MNKHKYVLLAMLMALILLNAYDVYSTRVLLNNGAAEANPFVAFMLEKGGDECVIAFKSVMLLWLAWLTWRAKTRRDIRVLYAGVSFLIVCYGLGMYFVNMQAMNVLWKS